MTPNDKLAAIQAKSLAWRREVDPDATDATVIEHMGREVRELMNAKSWKNMREETADIALILAHLAKRNGWQLRFAPFRIPNRKYDGGEVFCKGIVDRYWRFAANYENENAIDFWWAIEDFAFTNYFDLLTAMEEKLAIAMARTYAGPDAAGVVEHVRGSE